MQIGPYKISQINFGNFRLDGGAMFGSVPKNLWSKRLAADTENCIPLATRCLVIEDGTRRILVDVGLGSKWEGKTKQIFAVNYGEPETFGLDPAKVTDVILTHLHFDHAGGISKMQDGKLVLTYPNATVHLQAANFENGKAPHHRERASYLKENIEPLSRAKLNLIPAGERSTEILPGIFVHRMDGHTEGQQTIEVRSGDQRLFYATDLIPTAHHLPVPFHMGYDMCAKTLMAEKEAFLTRALNENAVVFFEHDTERAATTVCKDERGHFAVGEEVKIGLYSDGALR